MKKLCACVLGLSILLAPVLADAALYSPIGSLGTPGTPTSCGTSPSLVAGSTDAIGTIILGTGVVTSCTLPFSTTLSVAPPCIVSAQSTVSVAAPTSITTSQLVIGLTVSLPGGSVNYFCPIK